MRRRNASRHRISILIADYAGVFRLGLKKLFGLEDDLRVTSQAETIEQAVAMARSFKPNLVFIQSELVAEGGIDRLWKESPSSKVVVMTASGLEEESERFVKAGAAGVIAKSVAPEVFVKCARKVAEGEFWIAKAQIVKISGLQEAKGRTVRPADTLTRREMAIISCLTQGFRNREIAAQLSISEQTVKNHLRSVYDKVGVSDRLELVLYAIHQRLELPPIVPAAKTA